jgi:hypothetical protein
MSDMLSLRGQEVKTGSREKRIACGELLHIRISRDRIRMILRGGCGV